MKSYKHLTASECILESSDPSIRTRVGNALHSTICNFLSCKQPRQQNLSHQFNAGS